MKYLKLFKNHGEYQDFVSGDTMIKPNVSHCVTQKDVHYNPRESIVSGTIRTSDFDKIVYGNGEGYVQHSLAAAAPSYDYSLDCQYKTNLYYYKNFDVIQRENGVNDVHVSYAANLINPDVNAVLSRYTVFQDDGITVPSDFYKIYFNEQDFLNGSDDYSLWLDMDGTVRGVKEDGEVIKDGDNYVTENVVPRFGKGGLPMYDSQNNPIYYNNKYIVKTPVDDIPFSSIRIDGQRIDLNKLVLDDRGFYVLEEGEHLIEYALKNRREIPSYAFNSCVALEDVKIPKKVKKIDIDAFSNCPLLGTDENAIMRICSIDSEPIVVEATFDFEENEEKILQAYASGIFNTPSSSDGGGGDVIKKVSETRETYNNDDTTVSFGNYYVINNGVVADVDCIAKTNSTEK